MYRSFKFYLLSSFVLLQISNSFTQELTQLPNFLPAWELGNKPDSIVIESYNRNTGDINLLRKYVYSYNSTFQVISRSFYNSFLDSSHETIQEEQFEYDSKGFLDKVYDPLSNLVNHFDFTSSGNISEFSVYDNGILCKRENYNYNTENQLISITDTFKNGGIWEYYYSSFTWDDFNHIKSEHHEQYANGSDEPYIWGRNYENNYDTNGVLRYTIITYNETEIQKNYFYNQKERNKLIVEIKKNPETGLFTDTLTINEFDYNSDGILAGQKYYLKNNSLLLVLDSETKYYYSYPTAIKAVLANNSDVEIYPNPTRYFLNISGIELLDLKEVKIYNLYGQLVSSQISPNTSIDISMLARGEYFIVILGKSSRTVKKLLVD